MPPRYDTTRSESRELRLDVFLDCRIEPVAVIGVRKIGVVFFLTHLNESEANPGGSRNSCCINSVAWTMHAMLLCPIANTLSLDCPYVSKTKPTMGNPRRFCWVRYSRSWPELRFPANTGAMSKVPYPASYWRLLRLLQANFHHSGSSTRRIKALEVALVPPGLSSASAVGEFIWWALQGSNLGPAD